MSKPIPIYLIAGFLGSGKTTLLNHALDYVKECGKKPAVIMNELGEINIDGKMVDVDVPMAEMLSGCICCTMNGDLSMTILELYREHRPDVIFIEATGIANPKEILEGVTETSMLMEAEFRHIVTVIDASAFLALSRSDRGPLYQLIGEGIMAAGTLIANKIDKVEPNDLMELEKVIRDWNSHAPICHTVYCQDSLDFLEEPPLPSWTNDKAGIHSELRVNRGLLSPEEAAGGHAFHHSHEHILVHTHYFKREVELESFRGFLEGLPPAIYRAKGLMRFKGEALPSLFQYTFGQLELFSIRPDVDVTNVTVFLGDHFSRLELAATLDLLEHEQIQI